MDFDLSSEEFLGGAGVVVVVVVVVSGFEGFGVVSETYSGIPVQK